MYFKWVVHAVIFQLTKFSAGKPRCFLSIISLIIQLINNDSFEGALRQKINGSTCTFSVQDSTHFRLRQQ